MSASCGKYRFWNFVSKLNPYRRRFFSFQPFIIPRDMSTPWLMNRSEIVTAKKVVPPSQVCPVVHNAPSKQANFTCSKPVLNPAPCSTNTMGCNNSSINTTNPATATESTQLSGFGTPLPLEPDEGLDMCGPHFSCLSVKEESTVDTGIASRSQTDDSSVGSSGNRRLTRRQTKLMAAQNTPEGMVPCFTWVVFARPFEAPVSYPWNLIQEKIAYERVVWLLLTFNAIARIFFSRELFFVQKIDLLNFWN